MWVEDLVGVLRATDADAVIVVADEVIGEGSSPSLLENSMLGNLTMMT
jgi:hypothetical protein